MRRGSHEDALDYVTKERTRVQGTSPVIRGEPPKQGKRSDLEDFTRAAIGGQQTVNYLMTSLCRFSATGEPLEDQTGMSRGQVLENDHDRSSRTHWMWKIQMGT